MRRVFQQQGVHTLSCPQEANVALSCELPKVISLSDKEVTTLHHNVANGIAMWALVLLNHECMFVIVKTSTVWIV